MSTAPTPARADLPGGSSRRVLVVDDESGMRLVLGRALARLGYEAFLAGSGAEALAHLQANSDVLAVISDVAMPVMTGLQLLDQILEEYPGLPVLFVTSTVIVSDLVPHPLVEILPKPVQLDRLRDRLGELIDRGGRQPRYRAAAAGAGVRSGGTLDRQELTGPGDVPRTSRR